MGPQDNVFEDTFSEMLAALRGIKGNGDQPYDVVSKKLVDTATWGLPQPAKDLRCAHVT